MIINLEQKLHYEIEKAAYPPLRLYKADIIDPASRLRGLISKWDRNIQQGFLDMVNSIKKTTTLDDLVRLIETNRIEEAFITARAHASRLAATANNAYMDAAASTEGFFLSHNIVVDFNLTHPRAVQVMANRRLRMVNGFMQQQEAATRQALVRGVQQGLGPREVARSFRSSVGLTPSQEQIIANYRQQLENLDSRALNRALRDGRFDRTVTRAIKDGRSLSTKQIGKMTDRYRERWISFRAETIARTESLGAVHQGSKEMYEQAIEQGEIAKDDLLRTWLTAQDGRQRDSHDFMHHQERAHDELFDSGMGNGLEYPGDPGAPDEEIAQCRCAVTTRIKGETN